MIAGRLEIVDRAAELGARTSILNEIRIPLPAEQRSPLATAGLVYSFSQASAIGSAIAAMIHCQ
jgi:hypothetical protein